MRVATLSTRYSTGGAQLNSLLIAQQLSMRGHDTEAWFLMRAGDLAVPEGLRTRVMSESSSHGVLNVVSCARSTLRESRRFQPDVIIGFHPLANILGALAAGCSRYPTRFIATQRNPSSSQGRWTGRLESLIGSTGLYTANIAVTGAVAASYARHPVAYRNKLTVVHNGSPPLVETQDAIQDCRRRFGLPVGEPVLGSLGRLAEQKNPRFLLDVLAHLPSNTHLAFAGDGPLRGALQEESDRLGFQGRIHFVGELHGEDVARFYRAIDIFALPSHFEGFGRTLVEAMSQQVPVVAHMMPVTTEVVGEAGVLLPLDAKVWGAEMMRMFGDPAARTALVERGIARAAGFTVEAMIDGYEALLA